MHPSWTPPKIISYQSSRLTALKVWLSAVFDTTLPFVRQLANDLGRLQFASLQLYLSFTISIRHLGNITVPLTREAIIDRLKQKRSQGLPIIGGGAGTGISAKCEEDGGIDLIVIYNSGRFRMAGRGSLSGLMPYGNANQIVKEMAHEVLTVVKHTPVIAGVCATDPFMLRDQFLGELKAMGFAGIQNFPTVGLIDGVFRANLEETGMGFDKEIECIAAAHQLDLLTTPYAFEAEQARALTQAGADIIVAHWVDHQRHDRCEDQFNSGSVSASHRRDRGSCSRRSRRCICVVSWRPDCDA